MEILIPMIILQVVTFAALVFVLRKLMYSASTEEARRLKHMEEEYIRRTQELALKMDSVDKEYKAKVNIAEEEARHIREQAKVEAEKIRDESLTRAHDESERIVNQAINTRNKIRQELESQLQDKAFEIARGLIPKIIESKHQKALHAGLAEEMVDALEGIPPEKFAVSPDKGEVTAAYELGKDAVEKMAAVISKKAGKKIVLTEKIDKTTVAGAVIRLGSIIIDGSISGRLRDARAD